MKPKILNDFVFQHTKFVLKEELRKEAINWVWFLKECMDMKHCCFFTKVKGEPKICDTSCLDMVEWIKVFFNLTEDELK